MMLMTNDVLAQQFEASDGGMKSLLPRSTRNLMMDSSTKQSDTQAFTVVTDDIVVQDTVYEIAPVKYSMKVSVKMHKASWTLPPHRYSDFESLHHKLCNDPETKDLVALTELPPKHLLIPTRTALIQRSVGLQRYCAALLRSPSALRSREIIKFFELEDKLLSHISVADKDMLSVAMQKAMLSPRTRSRSEAAKEVREAEQQADRVLPKSTTFRSPKRGVADDEERLAATAVGAERDERDERDGEEAAASKRLNKSPRLSRFGPDGWSRLLEPDASHEGAASAWSQLVARPLQDAAAFWGDRRAKPTGSEQDDLDVPETPLTRDLPLRRSGVSDVMGAIGLS